MQLLPLALATMALAQILDLGTFVTMVRRVGLGAEANPIVAGLVMDYGLPVAAVVKVALLAFIVALAVVLERRGGRLDRVMGVVVIAAAIGAGLVGGGSNVLTMGPLALAK
jgi:hypothetical protein